ncbi:MAG: VWA domain-containing protein [Planctomycetota bacterium]
MPTLAQPTWLLLALLAIPLGLVLIRYARSMTHIRRWAAALVRLALLAALALLLADASRVDETDRLAVVVLVDASDSIERFGSGGTDDAGRPIAVREAVRGALRQIEQARGPDDLVGVVAFGGSALAVATPTTADVSDRPLDVSVADGTGIAAAIDFARALLPPDASGRLLLITDGNETSGDAVAAAERAAAGTSPVRIDAIPIEYRVTGETIVQAITPPARAPSDTTVPVRVEIASTNGTTGTLRLERDGTEIDADPSAPGTGRRLSLGPGRHVILLDAPVGSGRLSRFKATFEPDGEGPGRYAGDAQLDNNSAEAFTLSPGMGQVLLVRSSTSSAAQTTQLTRALESSTRAVQIVDATAIPTDVLGLQDYDLIILDNVPADEVAQRAQSALAVHVTEAGAGLVMVGGRASFGAGGWAGTPIEPILPVHLDLGERLVERRTAIVFVLDSSGSMGSGVGGSFRSQQQIANAAAAGAAATLGPTDLVGVVSFSSDARWVVDLAENAEPARTGAAINAIASGGGTNLPPALELARQALAPVEAAVKHVIVLSDGRSNGAEELPDLAKRMADEGINVSAISVGDSADLDTMFQVAELGGGVHYPVTNPNVLPRVFVRAVRLVRDPLIKEGEIPVARRSAASSLIEPADALPPLAGIVLTRFRDDPTVINAIATGEDEPVLAHWNAGLGRVAAYTADHDGWSRPWIAAGTFDRLWARIAQTIARPSGSSGLELNTEIIDGELNATLIATDDAGAAIDGLTVRANIYKPDGSVEPVVLDQIAPGEYAATIPAGEPGNYIAIVRPASNGGPLQPVLGGATGADSLEYRRLASDRPRVERIARAAGGDIRSLESLNAAELFDRTGVPPRRAQTPLRDELLILTLALLLLDVAARRIAWDRFLGDRAATANEADAASVDLSAIRRTARSTSDADRRVTLSDEDAAAVAREARRKRSEARRKQRPAAEPSEAPQAPAPPPAGGHPRPKITEEPNTQPKQKAGSQADRDEPGGLLAAKRRARDRFDS